MRRSWQVCERLRTHQVGMPAHASTNHARECVYVFALLLIPSVVACPGFLAPPKHGPGEAPNPVMMSALLASDHDETTVTAYEARYAD
jgi:hypothetical protein